MSLDTRDASDDGQDRHPDGAPGLVVLFSGKRPAFIPLAFAGSRPLALGRSLGGGLLIPDERMSRHHAEIRAEGNRWLVRDLNSRNGTYVDGVQVRGEIAVVAPRVVRLGDTLLAPCADTRGAAPPERSAEGVIAGLALRQAWSAIDRAARTSDSLLVRGESGTGKELAARRYHAGSPRASGPFIAVNCAAIPEGLAERLLFGAKRGAYSGASADAEGHVEAADGGTLFLDEAGELDLEVQAKLLRVLETREVQRLGASVGRRVQLNVCLATHRDLRRSVAEGKFRADLYHRVCPPEVVLPPLRSRGDEIPLHLAAAIASAAPELALHAQFVEACMLRAWPGNVRELRKEAFHAAARAKDGGEDVVRAEHLGEWAGRPIEPPPEAREAPEPPPRPYVKWSQRLSRDAIAQALRASEGNVARAAENLGMRRTQLYREMQRVDLRRRHDA